MQRGRGTHGVHGISAVAVVVLLLAAGAGVTSGQGPAIPALDPDLGGDLAAESGPGSFAKPSPLHFEPNLGQIDAEVLFTARAADYTFFLTTTEAVFVLAPPTALVEPVGPGLRDVSSAVPPPHPAEVVRIGFVDGAPEVRATGKDPLPGVSNHFRGNDATRWATNVPHFAEVVLQEVWPGIDIVFRGTEGAVQYDFIVHPGADPAAIRLEYHGATPRLTDDGRLLLYTDRPVLEQPAPYTYQDVRGDIREIGSGFVLLQEHRIGFRIDTYDPTHTLVIDPLVLGYSTYLGGGGHEYGQFIAVDANGSAYLAGTTWSTDFPTQDPVQGVSGGAADIMVVKLSPDGGALVYSTYLGGAGDDSPGRFAVDPEGHAYLTGRTDSDDFPLNAPIQSNQTGISSAFVTKISAQGDALVYSTYLTGNGEDHGHSLAIDADGSAYVAGGTTSTDLTTNGSFQGSKSGGLDAFVTKITPAGDAIAFSTYLGGALDDRAYGIAIDGGGDVYITGTTSSTDFPTERSIYPKAGYQDIFITKIAAQGDALIYSTFIGGRYNDYSSAIAVDREGSAHITGWTASDDFPVKNASQSAKKHYFDAVVVKLTANGDAVAHSTFLGGHKADYGRDIAVALDGSLVVAGSTESNNFPAKDHYQYLYRDGWKAFASRFTATGQTIWSTTLGGSTNDLGQGVGIGHNGHIYIGGSTLSTDFPTSMAYQPSKAGGRDAFVTKFVPVGLPSAPTNVSADPGQGRIILQWDPPQDDGEQELTGYTIYGSEATTHGFSLLGNTGPDLLGYIEEGLAPNHTRHYRIFAVTSAGPGEPATVSHTTQSDPGPTEVGNLTALAGAARIGLDWTPPADDRGSTITGYRIHASDDEGSGYTQVGTTGVDTLTFTESGLRANHTRHYRVVASFSDGEGDSAYVTQTSHPGATPPGALFATRGIGNISLGWAPPADSRGYPVTGYLIYGSDVSSTGFSQIGATDAVSHTFIEEGLPSGKTRHYQVVATTVAGSGEPAIVGATTFARPDPPQEIEAIAGPRQITLRWAPPSDTDGLPVTEYTVRGGNWTGHQVTIGTTNGTTHTFTETGLAAGQSRYYTVLAHNDAGKSDPSIMVIGTTIPPPTIPLNVTVGPGLRQLIVEWEPPYETHGREVIGYRVWTGARSSASLIATLGPDVLEFTHTGLQHGETRGYAVQAATDAGYGPLSGFVSATTFKAPSAPQALKATPGYREVSLEWDPPADDGGTPLTRYRILQKSESASSWTILGSAPPDDRTYTSRWLTDGTTYDFKVQAENAAGLGALSDAATARVPVPHAPAPPQTLSAGPGNETGEIELTWDVPRSDGWRPITGYTIYRSTSRSSGYEPLATVGPDSLNHTDTAPPLASRHYRVTAHNAIGESAFSNRACSKPNPWTLLEPDLYCWLPSH